MPQAIGKAGVKVRVRLLALAPGGLPPAPCGGRVGDAEPKVGVVLCPLLGVLISQVGLAWVG